ncbi:MAG TPA: ABC transporter ATP-binding protein [Thermoanaerobaculia bacterium]|jgi:ATP-binding cassette subfamily B protein|nr:ABC transporter ATP-binding protein [Thermoanaerobaculia bacterium]
MLAVISASASGALHQADRPMARLFAYLQAYRGRLTWACTSSVFNKILDLMPPLLVGWVIDSLRGAPPGWIARLAGTSDPWSMAVVLSGLSVGIFFFESLFQWFYQAGFMSLAQLVQHDLRMDAYNKIQSREVAFFEEHRLGEILSMLNDDVNQLERFLNTGFNELLQIVVLFIFAGIMMFSTSWQLSLVGMAPIPIILWGSVYYQRRIAPRYRRVREGVGGLASRLENNIAGIQVIKSFTAEPFETERVRRVSEEYRLANFGAIRLSALYVPLIRMAIVIGFAGVLLVGSYWVLQGRILTVGELVLFAMMTERLLWPLTRLGTTLDDFERANASARRTFGLLDTPAAILEPENPVRLGRAQGEVVFDRVEFRYPSRQGDLPVLDGVTFRIAPGETLGVAGPTGAGKSTIIKLLLRFYDVTGGSVRLDGHNVRDLALSDLRHNIALVSQDVYLFHGTIRENIAYVTPDAPIEEVVRAAQLAQLHDFVASLPQGYDTLVGERGVKLSGGQRQRLSIARAILKDAPILILDEATSSVDTETERAIQQSLRTITAGRTALIIAHRLSTIRHADRILVLRDGKVAEEGHHDDLVARGGTYAELWHIQSGELEEALP